MTQPSSSILYLSWADCFYHCVPLLYKYNASSSIQHASNLQKKTNKYMHANVMHTYWNLFLKQTSWAVYGGAQLIGMESSERCNLTDHLLKARGEEVCGVYLVYPPRPSPPPGLTLPPLDRCALPLTLIAAPLFFFPPYNSVTNWACQKTIYHCPTSHPPLPSVSSSWLYLFPLLFLLQDISYFPRTIFSYLNDFMFFSPWALYLSALAAPAERHFGHRYPKIGPLPSCLCNQWTGTGHIWTVAEWRV